VIKAANPAHWVIHKHHLNVGVVILSGLGVVGLEVGGGGLVVLCPLLFVI
jgi:hypothetical protein